ncbi:MAG: YheC/YheD family protein [Thermincola sp.]|jgi:glutathione synthase/RimK-type ligase-like ATP-grasp enzyme|nr:YheC/YheD family protein [Thermincola sp.]MDT3703957.1 YheC/YheD family protein [Thermincola sp.]
MPCTTVTPINHQSQIIFLTDNDLSNLALKPDDQVSVRAGSTSTNVIIAQHAEKNLVTSRVLESLHLPSLKKLTMVKAGNEIVIGPLIGIMASRSKKRGLPPYTLQNNLLHGFLNHALNANYVGFTFFPEDVDMNNHKISGFFLAADEGGRLVWKKHDFPLPDAVYDRVMFRSMERKKNTKEVTSYFIRNNILYFNPKFMSKWETYQILRANPKLHSYLPDTKKYESPDLLLKFMGKYQTVYLKPTNGSLGKDIVRISRIPEGFRFQYRKKKEAFTGVWPTPRELCNELPKLVNSKFYIMQQGLDLIRYNGRVFDIRVLMQKDGQGKWGNTATVARIAASGSIFPNIAAGGVAKNMEGLWRDLTSADWLTSQTYENTIQVSLDALNTLENRFGTFVEAGLDIGIDALGNIWIIEINSKPSRKVFAADQLHLKEKSITLPIDFAAHLSGFTPDQRWGNN